MRFTRVLLLLCLLTLSIGLLFWLAQTPQPNPPPAPAVTDAEGDQRPVFRIGIVPERDIFAQRERYLALGRYLAEQIDQPVEILTAVSYARVVEDLGTGTVDAAFLGSLATVLAQEQLAAFPIAHPVHPDATDHYSSVLFVPGDSSINTIADLAGKRLAMVRTTYAGHLFPVAVLLEKGMWNTPTGPQPVWVGTHDEVIHELAAGRVDAGAVKNLRLDAYERQHPAANFRRLLTSAQVPENAMVLPASTPPQRVEQLRRALLAMPETAAGRDTLERFGATHFVSCEIDDYRALYDLVGQIGERWPDAELPGPPPRLRRGPQPPATAPAGGD